MRVWIQVDADGSIGVQASGRDYQPDVFDDVMARCKTAALELWSSTHEADVSKAARAKRPK